jgi:serine/threonine protein kinase
MEPDSAPNALPTSPPVPPPAPGAEPYASANFAHVVAAVRDLGHPAQVGPYLIRELIGEGGMGSVYRAEQRAPIQRVVALKLIKLGMDTREVVARFESERQALALMDHPNVAKVLDAGATETGRPYFVMEFVKGEPITRYADRHKLTVRQRLELFTQACEAIQHAHQKAIIHRDLKPSNILVTQVNGKPQVKVIDFGVAKALSQRLTERTLFTETGQLIGTPEYMAPEQAEGSAVLDTDTRSDVYSLGVVLYELLSGALPFDPKTLRSAGYNEIQRIIRETDPPRPSTRLSRLGKGAEEVARLRQTSLEVLARQLKGELEWIPLKAMQKERARRYASATELADDIVNYLANQPLRAAPDSAAYRVRKFLRRNKAGVAASAAMVFLLLAGIAATAWQAYRATRAEREVRAALRKAEDAVADVRAVNQFLTEDLLASAAPEVTRGRELTVREALDRAAAAVARRLADRPLTEAAVRSVLADTYDALGKFEPALAHAQAARDVFHRLRGPDDEQAIAATHEVGRELAKLHRHAEAEPMLRDALARARRVLGDEHPVTLTCASGLAMTLRMQERFAEAEPLYRSALEAHRRVHGPHSEQTARALNSLAVLMNTQLRAAEAEPLYRESLAIRAKLLGEDHPAYLSTLANLSRVVHDQGKFDEAEAMMRRVLAEERRILGDDHPSTLLTMNNLASLLADQEKYEQAESLHRDAWERRTRALGPDHPDTLQSMANLGATLMKLARFDDAEPLLQSAMVKRRAVLGETHPYTIGTTMNLAMSHVMRGKLAEAEPLFARVCQPDVQEKLTPDARAETTGRWGALLASLKQPARAEPVLLDARRQFVALDRGADGAMRPVLAALADVCDQTNRPEEAARWRAELRAIRPATSATDEAAQPAR